MPAFHSNHPDNTDFSENGYSSPLDLNRHLISHPAAEFFLRIDSNALCREGIIAGDTLIVNRALPLSDNCLAVVEFNGELLARRIKKSRQNLTLLPASPDFHPQTVSKTDNFSLWGIITASFRKY